MRISRNRLRLQEWFHINLPAPEVVETFADNAKFYSYARQENLPVPTTFLVDNRSDLSHAANHIPYPCLLKPPLSGARTWERSGSLKAYRAGNPDELVTLYDQLKPLSERFIVQAIKSGRTATGIASFTTCRRSSFAMICGGRETS